MVYLFLGLVMMLVFYTIPGLVWPPTFNHYLAMVSSLVLSVAFLIIALTKNYYVIEKDGIRHYNFRAVYFYAFGRIIYIDEAYSEKNKTVRFYMEDGTAKYLTFDRDGKIYKAMKEKSSSLLGEEEFRSRFLRK